MKQVLKIWSEGTERRNNTFIVSPAIAKKISELKYAGGFTRFTVDLMDELPDTHQASKNHNIARFLSEIMGEKYLTIYEFLRKG